MTDRVRYPMTSACLHGEWSYCSVCRPGFSPAEWSSPGAGALLRRLNLDPDPDALRELSEALSGPDPLSRRQRVEIAIQALGHGEFDVVAHQLDVLLNAAIRDEQPDPDPLTVPDFDEGLVRTRIANSNDPIRQMLRGAEPLPAWPRHDPATGVGLALIVGAVVVGLVVAWRWWRG